MRVKPVKIFECSCANGFTGDFCEFKAEQNQLLYRGVIDNDPPLQYEVVVNDEGRIHESIVSNSIDNAIASRSCLTVLNGEAVIFGGYGLDRQVTQSTVNFSKHSFIF